MKIRCRACDQYKELECFSVAKQNKYNHERKYWCKQCVNVYNKTTRQRSTESTMLSCAKQRAKKFNVPFDMTLSDIRVPAVCPLSGLVLKRGSGKGGSIPESPSLDRIIPAKGYVSGNVQVISLFANFIKSHASFDDFERIYLNWKKQLEQEKNNGQSSRDE